MKVSVIVPTFNGAHKLPNLFTALQKQTYSNFELVVVVDGSTDDTLDILKAYIHNLPSLKYILQENQGRSAVRNRGAKESTGELLIFYDDDMLPFPDSIQRHLRFHEAYKGLCTGSQFEQHNSIEPEIHNYKAYLSQKWLAPYPSGVSQLSTSNLFFTAANCSVRRELFFQLSGFDERLTDGEDYNLAYGAIERGIPVFFDKSNLAIHHDKITARSYIRRLRQYRLAHLKLLQLHPSRKVSIRKTHFLKRTLYWLGASSFLVRLIDVQTFRWYLPQKFRFKLYDWIIQSLANEFPERKL